MTKDGEKKAKVKLATAQKRDIQNEKKRLANREFKSNVRTAIRRLEDSLAKNETGEISKKLNEVYALMDKGVKNGAFKLNKAARVKSRLAAKVAKV